MLCGNGALGHCKLGLWFLGIPSSSEVFQFSSKVLDLEQPSFLLECDPFPESFRSCCREDMIASWQAVEQAARTFALYPFGGTATWRIIPFELPARIALPLITTRLNVLIRSVPLMCWLFACKGMAKCASRSFAGLPDFLTKIVGHLLGRSELTSCLLVNFKGRAQG